MSTRNSRSHPPAIRLWLRTAMFLLVGAIAAAICAYYGWWITMTIILVPTLFFAWWVSPARKGQHTPWLDALTRRAPDHAIIVWSPADKHSAQIQIALQPTDPRTTWVNYHHDTEAWAFAQQHGGFAALPIALIGERVLENATSGQVFDALDSTNAEGTKDSGEAPER